MSDPSKPVNQVDISNEKIKWDFKKDMSYGDYLGLDAVLGAQHLRSGHHDEMLFLVIHQVSELWMKLVLHELQAAVRQIKKDELEPGFKMLARMSSAVPIETGLGCPIDDDASRLCGIPG